MSDLLIVAFYIVGGWTVCGAIAYALFTCLNDCYLDGDEVIRAVVAVLGPIGLALMVFATIVYLYVFVIGKFVKVSTRLVCRNLKLPDVVETDDFDIPPTSGGSRPNQIFL